MPRELEQLLVTLNQTSVTLNLGFRVLSWWRLQGEHLRVPPNWDSSDGHHRRRPQHSVLIALGGRQRQAPEGVPLQCPQAGVALLDTFLYLCHLSVPQHPLCACYSQAGGQGRTHRQLTWQQEGDSSTSRLPMATANPKAFCLHPGGALEAAGVAEDAQECGRDRDQHRLAAATGSWVLSATLDLPPLGNPCGQISTTDCERENHLQSRLEVQRGGKTTFIITVITIINTTFLPEPHAKQSPALPLSPYPTRQEERVTLQTIATQPPKPTQLLPFDHKSRQINICS